MRNIFYRMCDYGYNAVVCSSTKSGFPVKLYGKKACKRIKNKVVGVGQAS